MKAALSTEQTAPNIARLTSLLAETPKQLEKLSKPLSAEQLSEPPGKDERSFTEVLAHLLNVEARSSEAIYLALLAKEPLFTDLHPERQWGKLMRYDQLPFSDLLTYFKFRRIVLMRVLTSLTEPDWSRSIREAGKQRKESVYWRARTIALHETEHLSELETRL
jgi:hypothetical protein